MPLPIEIIVGATGSSGGIAAGTSSANGAYVPVTGSSGTFNGATQYTNGVDYISWSGTAWIISTVINDNGENPTSTYQYSATGSIGTFPVSGWVTDTGALPTPTFALVTTGLASSYICTNPTLVNGGAGIGSATYLPVAGSNATYNSVTQYSNGTNYLSWASSGWNLTPTVNTTGFSALYISVITLGTMFPLTGWYAITDVAPVPIFIAGSGGGGVIDTPTYPYEEIINLQQYTLTSNDCTNPQYAIDDIETTDAVFPAGGSVSTNTTRFLKVDWGYDAWITRIRINQATTTSTSYAGINYESSYGLILDGAPAPQVPILAVTPIPEGNGVYSIYFTPPVLARGIEYYPDFNNPSLSSLPEVDLYQLQVYEDTVWQTGVSTNMPIQGPTPTVQFTTVGIELLTIYPWVASASYPFPSASAVPLYAIQGLDFDAKTSLAIVRGGDSVHELGAYETHRETTGKFMVEQSDLRTFSLFLGDQVIVDAASGSNGENQYATSLFGSQAPYFTVVGVSTHGDGTQSIVLPKVKLTGFTRNVDTDKPTDLEVSFKPFFDKTYKLQSGGLGGLYEFVNNSGTSVLPPS